MVRFEKKEVKTKKKKIGPLRTIQKMLRNWTEHLGLCNVIEMNSHGST